MSTYEARKHDALGEMMREARWLQTIGRMGRRIGGPVRNDQMDAMLEALVEANQLRRRLEAMLAQDAERKAG